jgi:hypothetical protein
MNNYPKPAVFFLAPHSCPETERVAGTEENDIGFLFKDVHYRNYKVPREGPCQRHFDVESVEIYSPHGRNTHKVTDNRTNAGNFVNRLAQFFFLRNSGPCPGTLLAAAHERGELKTGGLAISKQMDAT